MRVLPENRRLSIVLQVIRCSRAWKIELSKDDILFQLKLPLGMHRVRGLLFGLIMLISSLFRRMTLSGIRHGPTLLGSRKRLQSRRKRFEVLVSDLAEDGLTYCLPKERP